jgi:RNA polymerase sigma factor (TIGR02999 family)
MKAQTLSFSREKDVRVVPLKRLSASVGASYLPNDEPITILLHKFAAGDKSAMDRLVPLLYPELKKLARSYMRNENLGHTLQPTALVHQAYIRLVKQDQPDFRSRAHFMGVAAHIMRQILIDHARIRDAEKRGGGAEKFSLEGVDIATGDRPALILAVDDALTELSRTDPIKAQLIEMRFFGGLTAEESAEVLNIPVAEVRRHLRVAQAWLLRELNQNSNATPAGKMRST